MSEAIQTWLTNRLGIMVDVESESFLRMVQNGYLIAKLLYSSDLISEEQLELVENATDFEAAFDHVVIWLRNADFVIDDETRSAIADGKLFAAINLFYKLYLTLKDRDKLYFINKQVQVDRLGTCKTRFQLKPVPEAPPHHSDMELNPLSEPLQDYMHIIFWYKVRHAKLVWKCEKAVERYETYSFENHPLPASSSFDGFDVQKYILGLIESEQDFTESYETLLAQEKATVIPEEPNPKLAQETIVKMQKKRKQRGRQIAIKIQMERILMEELWKSVSVKVKRKADLAVSGKMLKQACFEKKIATKLYEVREQKNAMVNKRNLIDDEVKQKDDDLILEDTFFKIKEVDDEKNRYHFERERAVCLHRKVYEEMLQLRKKKKQDLCCRIVEDVVDCAVYEVEYFKHFNRVLYHYENLEEPASSSDGIYRRLKAEMAAMFKANESIFRFSAEDPLVLMAEEMHEGKQVKAQDAISEQYFLGYYEYDPPWELPKHAPSFIEKQDEILLGTNILGHVVFRLLLGKYPKPPPTSVPILPKVHTAVSVNNINDPTVAVILSKLLAERHVKIIQLEDAINSCLLAYKSEGNIEGPQFVDETNEALRSKTVEDKSPDAIVQDDQVSILPYQAQQVQTPKVLPGNQPRLSPRAELGRLAYEILSLGESLNDKLLAKIFVDYLKELKDIDGWVLMNYPQNFEQAAILEETLTANPVPRSLKTIENEIDLGLGSLKKCLDCSCLSGIITNHVEDIADLEFRDVPQNNSFDDRNVKFRVSKLLANPDVPPPEVDNGTYLKAYVRIEQSDDDEPYCLPSQSELDEFYRGQGILYVLYYKVFDLPTIKYLAKLIMQDYSVPPKTSLQIFGDSVLYLESDFDQDAPVLGKAATSTASEKKKVEETKVQVKVVKEKKGAEKPKKGKKRREKQKKGKKAGKKGKFPKGAKVVIVRVEKETQIPEIEYVTESPPNLDVKPGEVEWVYVDVSIPQMLQVALASLWESVEHVYVTNMKQLFFRFRILWNGFVPYLNSVKDYMSDFIARPDDVQVHLQEFQVMFNEIDADMRNDDEVKAELHYRVHEFKEKLWERCDERMRIAEDERRKVISHDWVTKQVCELTDAYIMLVRLEIARCADTMQLLNDYYVGMITKMTSDDPVFDKTSVAYLNKDIQFESFVKHLLTYGVVKNSSSPFQKVFNDSYNTCMAATDVYQKRSLDLLEKMEKCFQSKGKKTPSVGGSSKGRRKLPKFTGPQEDVKQVGPKLIDEWRSAVTSEALRTKCRLNVVKSSMALEVVQGILPYAGMIFGDVRVDIFERYKQELRSVQGACDVFSRVIEEEAALQAQLVLDGYNFCIRADVLMFEDPLPEPEIPAEEIERPGIFSVKQLDDLVDFLLETAPRGVISEREFICLLQDLAHRTLEDGKSLSVPTAWFDRNLNSVSSYYFGETELVDWRDFVVYNLCLKFPSEEELMETRRQFREYDVDCNEYVYEHQYYSVKFWFDRRARKFKELLYKMYKVDEGIVNYTTLLLAFCKDRDPVLGLAKALELALGGHVCWQTDVGQAFKDNLRNRRKLEEQERARLDSLDIIEQLMAFEIPSEAESLEGDGIERKTLTYLRKIYREQYPPETKQIHHVSFKKSEPRLLFEDLQTEFESDYTPQKIYFLPFEALLNVLMAAMPWHSTVQNMGGASLRQRAEIAYETCRSPEFDHLVFAHEFLNSKLVRDLLAQTRKFTAMHPKEIKRNMTDIIKNWLTEIIGVPRDVQSESFVRNVQDGTLLAQLLHALCVIRDAQFETITKAEESHVAFDRVCTWLENLGFTLNPETRSNIAKGKLSAIIRLFYQLYLTLKRKDRSSEDRQSCSGDTPNVSEKVKDSEEYVHGIQLYKNRYADLLERCRRAADDYQRYTENLNASPKSKQISSAVDDFDELQSHYDPVKYTYDQLVEQQQKTKDLQVEPPDPKVSERIVGKFRKRGRQLKQRAQLKSQMEKILLDETLRVIVEKDVQNAESGITKAVLTQSSFEKKTTLKRMEQREEKRSALELKKTIEGDIKRRQDEELTRRIFSSEVDDPEACRYYFERDILLNLHREVYAKKLRMKARRISDMCDHALEDLVDLALAQAEYLEQRGEEMSPDGKTELAKLFVTGQQILRVVDVPRPQEEAEPEEIVWLETDVDAQNFEAYCDFQWPWEITDQEKLKEIQPAGNILGHIVFRLLLTKYPKPPPPPAPSDLPKFNVAVCVENLTDQNVLDFLDKLLSERKVKLIRMEEALDFCVKSYELETAMEYPEAQPEVVRDAAKKGKGKKKKGKGKAKAEGKKKKGKGKAKAKEKKSSSRKSGKAKKQPEVVIPQFQEKQVQTPKIYPCEMIELTPKAELGGYTGPIDDELLTKMFVEYIKSFKDVEGWVLINYPRNFKQASLLEKALTGRPVPPMDQQIETSSNSKQSLNECEHCECPLETDDITKEDKNRQYRISQLLTNPDPPSYHDEYKSYLTAYIYLSKADETSPPFPDAEDDDDLHTFYLYQGNLYTLYYKTLSDFPTMKHLAKLIVGDYSIPPKTSVQIFGDTILQMETKFAQRPTVRGKKQKKRKKSKDKEKGKPKKEKASKGKKSPRKIPDGAEVVITREDKETQIPEIKSEVDSTCSQVEETKPKPGEAHWRYVDLEMPDFFEVALATLWENVEEIYVSDFKDLFFNVRMLRQTYVPYTNYVKQYMSEYIGRPDDKQVHLQRFQSVFNEFDEDMRGDDEIKAELRCRLYQFREKMWEICDERLTSNEEQSKLIVEEDWLTRQTCELTNAYIAQLQLELDRCTDTLRLLNDYYVTVMTKMPAQEVLDKTFLTYIPFGGYYENPICTDYFKQLLLNVQSSPSTPSPFHVLLDDNFGACVASADLYQEASLRLLHSTSMRLQPKGSKAKTKLVAGGKSHFERRLPQFSEPPVDVKDGGPKLLEEWRCAINGEVVRVKLRCDLLKAHAHVDLQNVIDHARGDFSEIRGEIANRYRKEIGSVQNMYEILSRAITEEKSLQPTLVLDGDRFYMTPSVLLFEEAPTKLEAAKGKDCRHALSIPQLNDLVDVFMKTAPTGMIGFRAFTYILQDLIVQEILPPSWQQISMKNVSQLSHQFFGKSEVIDWKDFIVCNMCIDFPSEDQLMETRKQFRKLDANSLELVHTYEYHDVEFWFENDDPRSDQIKKLLHTMYKLSEDMVNYTALLLVFCKGENAVVGVAKALELALGRYVCWQMDVGEAFKDGIRRKKELEEEERVRSELEHMEKVEDADAIIDGLIDRAVHQCDSCFLEEITSITTVGNGSEESGGNPDVRSETFSNVEIGFEADSNPPKVYYLPFEVLPAVFWGAMPWCMAEKSTLAMTFWEKLEIAYEQHKDPEHNNLVLTHEFLNSEDFLDLLKDSFKFVVREPSIIIEELINNNM